MKRMLPVFFAVLTLVGCASMFQTTFSKQRQALTAAYEVGQIPYAIYTQRMQEINAEEQLAWQRAGHTMQDIADPHYLHHRPSVNTDCIQTSTGVHCETY